MLSCKSLEHQMKFNIFTFVDEEGNIVGRGRIQAPALIEHFVEIAPNKSTEVFVEVRRQTISTR